MPDEASVTTIEAEREARERASLPHPLRILESLTGTGHYHCGFFTSPGEPLSAALDRLVLESMRRLPRARTVLDVGCAMGGSSRRLAAAGMRVLGIDPCPAAITYARSRRGGHDAEFLATRLEDLQRERPAAVFDAVVMIEVLQHFRDLRVPLRACLEHLRPGGTLVVSDVFLYPALRWESAPFHHPGTVVDTATAIGYEVVERRDVTPHVTPTHPRLASAVMHGRARIARRLGTRRRTLDPELDELLAQLRLLESGFATGDLVYEVTVLRRPRVTG